MQGVAISHAEKLPLDTLAAGLRGCWPVFEPALLGALARIKAGRYEADENTPATVATCHASVRHVLAMSKEHGIDLGLPEALDRVFQRASDAGRDQDDLAAVYMALR